MDGRSALPRLRPVLLVFHLNKKVLITGLEDTKKKPRIAARHAKKKASHRCETDAKKRPRIAARPCAYLVGRGGIEPPTNGLKVRCSTG